MRGASRPHSGGALLVGRLLAAAFFFVDGAYKLSGTAWPSYRQFMFDSFKALGVYNNYSYGGLADVTAVLFCLCEVVGGGLLALGWRRDGRAIELKLAVAVHCRAQSACHA